MLNLIAAALIFCQTNATGRAEQYSPAEFAGWNARMTEAQIAAANRQPNPAFTRYWWLYSIAVRYGKTLPCDVTDLRAAMQTSLAAAPDWQTAAGINADATDAANAFTLNGGAATDWSIVPPETIQ